MTTISVPLHEVTHSSGFSMDFGSSALKTAVVVKVKENGEEWKYGDSPESAKSAHLLLKSFSRKNTNPIQGCVEATRAMIQFIKERGVLGGDGDRQDVHTTGVGVSIHKEEMEKEFNISLVNGNEIDSLVSAFVTLNKHLPPEELFYPVSQHIQDHATKEGDKVYNIMQQWMKKPEGSETAKFCSQYLGKDRLPVTKPLVGPSRGFYPCVLLNAGSAGSFNVVREDGSYILPLLSIQCGLFVLGMASLVCGVHTYSELLSLAEKGDEGNLTTFFRDVMTGAKGDIYDNFPKDVSVFAFGKAHQKTPADFKKEDLARAILHNAVGSLVDTARQVALANGANSVLYSGGLFNSQLTRDMAATRHYDMEAWGADVSNGLDIYFPRYGDFYGVIGGIFLNSEKQSAGLPK